MRVYFVSAILIASLARTAAADHDGLYLQLTPGVGVAATSTKLDDGSTLSLSGPGGTFGLAIGASITPSWIVALDVSATAVIAPTAKHDDMEVKTSDDVKWSSAYLGLKTDYYFMPLGFHVGGGLGLFRMALDVPNMDLAKSNLGGAAKLAVGKEWGLSDKWGLGISLESIAGVVPDDTTKGWGFFSLDLAVSATYR
jgi:hypothetical protein